MGGSLSPHGTFFHNVSIVIVSSKSRRVYNNTFNASLLSSQLYEVCVDQTRCITLLYLTQCSRQLVPYICAWN